MSVRKWNRTLPAIGLGAVLALGLTAAAAAPAAAAPKDGATVAAAAMTVTPSTNLLDGSVVVVSATGLRANTVYHIGQCAIIDDVLPCNGAETVHVSSNSTGNLATKLTIRRVYHGTLGPDATPWGPVDCWASQCGVGMFNDLGEGTGAAIFFRK